jgi:7-cyano-7-deazaguanine synthase in queuosine biosynthesis
MKKQFLKRNIYCEGFIPANTKISTDDLKLQIEEFLETEKNVRIAFNNFSELTVKQESLAFDLVRIASYVYICDCQTPRGGLKDAYDENWNVELNFFIPVSQPEFWNQPSIKQALIKVLNFSVEHTFNFEFSLWKGDSKQKFLQFFDGKNDLLVQKSDSVCLFSGGLDSLLCATKLLEEGKNPLLLSHSPTFRLTGYRQDLVKGLSEKYGKKILQLELPISNFKNDPYENTQRSRGFLFAALGIAFAKCLAIPNVYLSDNGIISFNLRYSDQHEGAMMSRSTNPQFIYLMNCFSEAIWKDQSPKVENTLLWHTKADVMKELIDFGLEDFIDSTTSCAYTRGISHFETFCGVCSQCVDRRFAVESLGLTDLVEKRERYKLNIFTEDLDSPKARSIGKTHSIDYYRKAKRINEGNEFSFFDFHQEIDKYVPPDEDPNEFLKKAYELHKRWSEQTLKAIGNLTPTFLKDKASDNSLLMAIFREITDKPKKAKEPYKLPPKEKTIYLNAIQRVFKFKNIEIDLTDTEFRMVCYCLKDSYTAHSHSKLVTGSHDQENNIRYSQTASTHRGNINKKIKQVCRENSIDLISKFDLFQTKHKVGFKLNEFYLGDFDLVEDELK